MTVATYPEYRSHTRTTFNHLPSHWEVVRGRHLVSIRTGSGDTVDADPDGEFPFFVRSDNALRSDRWEFDTTAVLTAGDGAGVAKVFHLVSGKFMAHQRVYVLADFKRVTPKFFYYAFSSMFRLIALDGSAKSTVDSVRRPMIADMPFGVPPVDEQHAITRFLDRETAKIDALILEQQGLVGVLRERRAAVITRAATRGIQSARLVPTGDPYLTEAPEHWRISRFGREMVLNAGQVDPREEPWADMTLVAPNHIESGTGRIIGRETAREQGADSGKYVARRDQILYSKIRPALNKVTLAVEDCLCSADMYAMSSRTPGDPKFGVYFMLSRPFHTYATLQSLRVKMPKVNREELGAAPWVVPPLDEQVEIANFLDEQTEKIDALIAEAEGIVAVANERRSALVTAAVTGQIDVREEVA